MGQARWLEVDPSRIARWVDGFGERHGGAPERLPGGGVLTLNAPDGSVAVCYPPPGVPEPSTVEDLAAPPKVPIGLLLVRRGGYAVGVIRDGRLVASKVDSRYVQGRTAAGGWSQQRFARRRENQTKAAAGEAADACVRLLLEAAPTVLVTGGDRAMVDLVLGDARLSALRELRSERFLPVPDPKKSVLEAAVTAARAVRIHLAEAPTAPAGDATGLPR